MSNTPLSPILAVMTSGSGEVTPAALIAATAEMTPAQQAQMRANIGATDAETSIPDDVKVALLDCFAHVAWVDDQGQTYYDALEAALYPLASISAVYTQSGTVYDTDSLDSLKTDLVVTAVYESGNTETVSAANYTLSGTLTAGTSTITVTYAGKTTTFNVTVTASGVYGYDSIGTPSISDNILTPGDSGMIRTTRVFSPGNNPWKLRVGYTTGTINSSSVTQDIFGSVNSSGTSERGVLMEGVYYSGYSKYLLGAYISSNGTSWDISSAAIVNQLVSNTTYLTEIEFTGTQYTIRSSTDNGATWSEIATGGATPTALNSSSKVKGGYYLGVGLKRNGYLNGTIDLTEVKVWINGELWWQPIR